MNISVWKMKEEGEYEPTGAAEAAKAVERAQKTEPLSELGETQAQEEKRMDRLSALSVVKDASEAPPSANPKEAMGALKPNMSLFPPVAEIYIAKVMEGGEAEYGTYNWRHSKISHTVYIAAARRHLAAMLDGQWFDPKSGYPHAAHVAASMGIIMDADNIGTLVDDLPPAGGAAKLMESLTQSV